MYSKRKWRLLADKHVEAEVVEFLRKKGFDVEWVTEGSVLERCDDTCLWQHAAEKGRYLLTYDRDFWDDRRFPLKDSPGVLWIDVKNASEVGWVVVLLRSLIRDYNPLPVPLDLRETKLKATRNHLRVKAIDRDTQKPVTMKWGWRELVHG